MKHDGLKLTIYFGERDRVGGRFLADALTDLYARHQLRMSLVMRGIEGFGIKHHLHTDRLLSLSEDLPLVSVAVDRRELIEAILPELNRWQFDGLVTLERARLSAQAATARDASEASKLTLYIGRHERVGRRLAYEAVVDLFHRRGLAGATVLLGVDGTVRGERQRARFFAGNAVVPLMVIGVGAEARVAEVLPELGHMFTRPLVTLERVRLCKLAGQRLAEPDDLPESDRTGMGIWQKLMVFAPEQARTEGHPLHGQVIRALRQAGASGATSLRGIWGYSGDHQPHGDSFWQLRRHVPTMTVTVDSPERTRHWFALIDELTDQEGVVTSEIVPAFRATGPQGASGGLRLALPGH